MPIFSIKETELIRIKEIPIKKEIQVQKLVESNLKLLFNLQFVRPEFILGALRIDTLAFDEINKSFVIIEYKKDRNLSVVDQGYAYLALLLNNKADFILEYNERLKKNLKRDDVDWSQSRVFFISPEFTKHQKGAMNFNDLPFELWEVSILENGMITFNQVKSPESSESITTVSSTSETVKKVSKEIKVYSENDLLAKSTEEIRSLYEDFKSKVMALGDVEMVPVKHYIGFKNNTNFVDVTPQKNALWIWMNVLKGELDDPKGMARDVSDIGHWGNGDYDLHIKPDTDLDYVMLLIKSAYQKQL
jgi:predicted transport protein